MEWVFIDSSLKQTLMENGFLSSKDLNFRWKLSDYVWRQTIFMLLQDVQETLLPYSYVLCTL